MRYLERIQKDIELPSGYTCTVRRQTQLDAIEIGSAPGFWLRNMKLKEAGKDVPEETEAEREAVMKFLARQNRVIVTRCTSGYLRKGEESIKISDKSPEETPTGELSWALLDSADVDAIINASNQLSGYTLAGQEARKTFPEQSADGSEHRPTGEALRSVANGHPEVVTP